MLVHDDQEKIIWHYDHQVLATLNSYMGHFQYARTRKAIVKIFTKNSFVNEYFFLYVSRVVRKYQHPRWIHDLKQQVRYFSKLFSDDLVLFQVGRYYETFGNTAEQLASIMNYQIKKQ